MEQELIRILFFVDNIFRTQAAVALYLAQNAAAAEAPKMKSLYLERVTAFLSQPFPLQAVWIKEKNLVIIKRYYQRFVGYLMVN
jgi:hypothetical protein